VLLTLIYLQAQQSIWILFVYLLLDDTEVTNELRIFEKMRKNPDLADLDPND